MTGNPILWCCQTVYRLLRLVTYSSVLVQVYTLHSGRTLKDSTRDRTTRLLLAQNTPLAVQICTQTEYYCGAGDVFLGSAHDALNKPGNCVLDTGAFRHISHR